MATADLSVPAPAAPKEAARAAGLRYVTDREPGIRRIRAGKGFRYVHADGRPVKDAATLARIKGIVIPPAWEDVWISPAADGHLQATGRDARGRKQYRYHKRWREVRDETKYGRMLAFAAALPAIRRRVARDLKGTGLPKERVLAAVVRLLETTHARVGNEEYARDNDSYGLTTLRNRHAKVDEEGVRLRFRGKGGKFHEIDVEDARLARIVRRCQSLPGQVLFEYEDGDGEVQAVGSADVNDYLREAAGEEFTAKDFRTWAGTVLAVRALVDIGATEKKTQAKKNVVRAVKEVAESLGNTPAVCRKSYVHPHVFDAYLEGGLEDALGRAGAARSGLSAEEARVVRLLERAADAKPSRRKRQVRGRPPARRRGGKASV